MIPGRCRSYHHTGHRAPHVSGSTLLQTNCILWLEGPSDRIYLNLWLRHHQAERVTALVEGSDYSFVYYGGKILSHFAFSCEGQNELIALIRVCRYSAVLMDRDTDPSAPEEEIRATKARISQEAAKDTDHRLAILTIGREIENDIDPKVFRKAAAKLLNLSEKDLSGFTLSGKIRYPDEVVAHLKLTGDDATKAKRKLSDKVSLAEAVAKAWTHDAAVPSYLGDLVKLIDRSRLP